MHVGIKLFLAFAAAALAVWLVVGLADADLSLLLDLDLEWRFLLASIPLYSVVALSRGVRLRLILGKDHSTSLLSAVSVFHSLATHILPFRTGEAVLPVMLRRYDATGLARGSAALISVRLMDFAVIFGAVALSVSLVHRAFLAEWWPWLGAGFLACLAGLAALTVSLMRTASHNSRPTTHNSLAVAAAALAATAVGWTALFGCYHLFIQWAGIHGLSYAESVLAAAGGVAAGFLPTNTLLSLGTLEAGWAAGLYVVGIDASHGVIAGFRLHAAIFLMNLICAVPALAIIRRTRGSAVRQAPPCNPSPLP